MSWLMTTRLGRTLAALGGLVVALAMAFAAGWRRAQGVSEADQLRRSIETERRARDAIDDSRTGGGGWHDRLLRSRRR